jgi:hypothetical protein
MSSRIHSSPEFETRSVNRRILATVALAIVSVSLLACVGVSPANAFSVTASGCPGTVQAPVFKAPYGTFFEFPQRYAWRSPCYASSTQVVKIRYRLWGLNLNTRQWQYVGEQWREGRSDPGTQGAWVAGYSAVSTWGNVSADVLVEWRLTNGFLIGSKYVDYNSVYDYQCFMQGCGIYTDPVVGAYIHF